MNFSEGILTIVRKRLPQQLLCLVGLVDAFGHVGLVIFVGLVRMLGLMGLVYDQQNCEMHEGVGGNRRSKFVVK